MRQPLPVLVTCLAALACHAAEDPVIPKGIRYKRASAKANQQAKQKLQKLFSGKATDQDALALFGSRTLICGPGLWRRIKDDPILARLREGKVVFKVPVLDSKGRIVRMNQLEGKILQSPKEVLLFWRTFARKTDFSNLKVRKLNPIELKIFWAMIPFDITEPLFILESEKHKILTVFTSPKDLRITWIDDYRNVHFRERDDSPRNEPSAKGHTAP